MKIVSMTLLRGAFAVAVVCGVLLPSFPAFADTNSAKSTNNPAAADAVARVQFAANKAAAEKGDPKALFEVARAYYRGLGVSKDPSKAVEYARLGAEKGYPPAEAALASFYGRGLGVPKNMAESIRWYTKAADEGDATAQLALGGLYESGKGVPKNIGRACQWLKQAALQGNAQAQCELGLIYFGGVTVDGLTVNTNKPFNYFEAVKWLQKAADQGSASAMGAIGYACSHALGGLPDDKFAAAKWTREAAEKGNVNAQASLGEMYRTGLGVPRDELLAYVWLTLAQAGGNEDGNHSAPEVAAILTPDQILKANDMVVYFMKKHKAEGAGTDTQ